MKLKLVPLNFANVRIPPRSTKTLEFTPMHPWRLPDKALLMGLGELLLEKLEIGEALVLPEPVKVGVPPNTGWFFPAGSCVRVVIRNPTWENVDCKGVLFVECLDEGE